MTSHEFTIESQVAVAKDDLDEAVKLVGGQPMTWEMRLRFAEVGAAVAQAEATARLAEALGRIARPREFLYRPGEPDVVVRQPNGDRARVAGEEAVLEAQVEDAMEVLQQGYEPEHADPAAARRPVLPDDLCPNCAGRKGVAAAYCQHTFHQT